MRLCRLLPLAVIPLFLGCVDPYIAHVNWQVAHIKELSEKGKAVVAAENEATRKGCLLSATGVVGNCDHLSQEYLTDAVKCAKDLTDGDNLKSGITEGDVDQCGKKIWDIYTAKLQLRYPLADLNWVSLQCRARGGCDAGYEETFMLESHNAGVALGLIKEYEERMREIQSDMRQGL